MSVYFWAEVTRFVGDHVAGTMTRLYPYEWGDMAKNERGYLRDPVLVIEVRRRKHNGVTRVFVRPARPQAMAVVHREEKRADKAGVIDCTFEETP